MIDEFLKRFRGQSECPESLEYLVKLWRDEKVQQIKLLRIEIIKLLEKSKTTTSAYGKKLLDDKGLQAEIKENCVKLTKDLRDRKVNSDVATVSWQAIMQATICSVREKRALTMIFSTRSVWFVKLELRDNKHTPCTIRVSNGYQIGTPGFNKKMILFLNEAKKTESSTLSDKATTNFENAAFIDDVEIKEGLKIVVPENSTGKDSSASRKDFNFQVCFFFSQVLTSFCGKHCVCASMLHTLMEQTIKNY